MRFLPEFNEWSEINESATIIFWKRTSIQSDEYNCLEVLARLRVFPLARIRVLSRGLFGLILAGLGWWDAGVFAGLFLVFFSRKAAIMTVIKSDKLVIATSAFSVISPSFRNESMSAIQAPNSSRREAQFTVVIS